MDILLFIILGVFIGFISGFFGIGGGGVIVPILMFLGYSIKEAIGISIMQMVFSSLMGSFLNYKNNLLKLSNGLFLGLGGACGAWGSGYVVKILPEIVIIFAFCCLLGFSIFRFFMTPVTDKAQKDISQVHYFLIGFTVGLIAISLGIGGAIFLVPILVGFFHVELKSAVSMGLFFVVFSSISGFISLSVNGLVNYKIGLIVGISSLIGAFIGTKFSHKIHKTLQKRLLLVLYTTMFCIVLNQLIQKL